MFTTLTLNPCLDLNLEVEEFRFDAPMRAIRERKRPGGKGINVSVALGILGLDSAAVAPLGGAAGEEFLELAGKDLARTAGGHPDRRASGTDEQTNRPARQTDSSPGSRARMGRARLVPVSIAAFTRTNIVITSRQDARHLKVNQRGGPLSPAELDAVFRRLRRVARPGHWLILAGSLPPGVPAGTYADLIREFRARGCFTALDADGEAFRLGVQAGPDIVKPNREELERFAGKRLRTRSALLAAAAEILRTGTRLCLITDGARPAWLVARAGARQPAAGLLAAWKGIPPRANGSPTGAGDAALAGLLAGLAAPKASCSSAPPTPSTSSTRSIQSTSSTPPKPPNASWNRRCLEKAFRLALACGSASASTPDTEYFDAALLKETLKRTRIERIL